MKTRGKVLVAVLALFALLGGATVVVPPLLWGDHADYSRVQSIERSAAYQDPALLARAFQLPVAARFADHVDYQRNGSFCGPTSVVNVMRSLGLPADQASVLDGTGVRTVLGLVPGGMTLDQVAEVVHLKTGRKTTVLRGLDLAGLRAHLRRSNDPAVRYIANFTRGPLFGRGGGHHSPVVGYLEAEDLALVLDVNAKYRPWLVRPERLLEAMNTVDPSSHQPRGLVLVE